MWANSVFVLALVAGAANSWALPHPDEYQIPEVGNNRRSQYYVLHDDGSFKYGYDTGDEAFESQKTNSAGDVEGKFGYKNDDGQDIRIEYTSGAGGFVARGDHIPQVHPDVASLFNAPRSSQPFVDPLADAEGDRSYNFNFDGDEYSRNEVSNSDGTVTGTYSYVDEFGRKKSYSYRAGKGIGFVIEGDDLPQPVQPLAPTHLTQATQSRPQGVARGQSVRSQVQHSPSRPVSQAASTSQRFESNRQISAPAATYFPPTPTAASNVRTHSAQISQSAAPVQRPVQAAQAATRTSAQFEAADIRHTQSPSGSYSVSYKTATHSRQESGSDDNAVKGRFSFTADDDGVERGVSYEASSATGFVASGQHLPIGPIVPGAPTGQVTGRIVPVAQVQFVDPLAKEDMDASYNFAFDSDTYSRSETADEDGNVSGTYSILGDDGILRTYRFRAGKGIGFETEEISAVPSQIRSSVTSTGQSSPPVVTTYQAQSLSPDYSSRASAQQPSFVSASTRSSLSNHQQFSGSGTQTSVRRQPSRSRSDSQKFTLRQYDPSEGRGKYGYVLRFDE